MHVLMTNDDSIRAPGIRALARAFGDAGYRVTVCAPDRERSACSHSLTMQEPLYVEPCPDWESGIRAYALSGTPADCVQFGLSCLSEEPVDLVVSGINHGANLGSDTLYSGTVAAAMEGAFHGKKALAVSLVGHLSSDFSGACNWALKVADWILTGRISPAIVYNLNLPPLPLREIRGLKAAPLCMVRYTGGYEKRVSPFGREHYWLRSTLVPECVAPGTDLWLTREGWATLTPLGWALADPAALARLDDELNTIGEE